MPTTSPLTVLPLGSCSIILGMDCLCLHRTKVDFLNKAIECVYDSNEMRTLQGKKKPILVSMVTTIHAKSSCRKGCVMFAMNISTNKGKEVEDTNVLRRYPVLQQFQYVFPKDITEFPPYR